MKVLDPIREFTGRLLGPRIPRHVAEAPTKKVPPPESQTTKRVTQLTTDISPIKLDAPLPRHLRTDLKGEILKGNYKIIEEIGRGGMAVVFKALHPQYGEVAVKVFDARNSDVKLVERFLKEGKKLLAYKHPNIIPAHELLIDKLNEVIFISMMLVNNKTLHDFIKGKTNEEKPLAKPDFEQVLKILIKIANALHYIHEEGLIHRDVKPLNILLHNDEPYLSDLGLARLNNETHLTTQGAIVGSPDHMAPEQLKDILDASGNPILDRRADIYAVGVILYEAITGRNPFKSDTTAGTLAKHQEKNLPQPNLLNQNVSGDCSSYILTMLETDPTQREPQTAGKLAQDLNDFLSGERKIWA